MSRSTEHRVIIRCDSSEQKISRHIYGHFAEHLGRCVYEGLWVGEESQIPNTRGFRNDVVNALKKLNVPNLRWPGGCFADTYHWMDGIGPRADRPSIVNVHWGGTTENNHCGTHEFLDLCSQIGCEPYIAGNVGSGTVKEMADWLEYLTMEGESPMSRLRRTNGRPLPWDVRLWGVGNENWGCGGHMRPQYYADLYRQYATYCRQFSPGKKLYKVACGLSDEWNDILLREAGSMIDGLSVHYYTVPGTWQAKGSATQFDIEEYQRTIQKAANIEDFIARTSAILDRHDPARRIGIVMDEWGTWYDVEPGTNPGFLYQQSTMRDAMVAGLTLNIFNNHAQRVQVANIAQTINVLQAMILTDGSRMLLTPTYHVFEMYKVHQDATLLPSTVLSPDYMPKTKLIGTHGAAGYTGDLLPVKQVSVSASRDGNGQTHISLCNLHHEESATVQLEFRGASPSLIHGRIITAGKINSHNTFESPSNLQPTPFDDIKADKSGITVSLPAPSVVMLQAS